MTHRTVLTSRQRAALFCVPEREADLLRHYTLTIERRRGLTQFAAPLHCSDERPRRGRGKPQKR